MFKQPIFAALIQISVQHKVCLFAKTFKKENFFAKNDQKTIDKKIANAIITKG